MIYVVNKKKCFPLFVMSALIYCGQPDLLKGLAASSWAYLDPQFFPSSRKILKQMRFWEKIFYHYPTHVAIIHDTRRPEYIIDIIDHHLWASDGKRPPKLSHWRLEQLTRSYLARYRLALKRFHEMGRDPYLSVR